MFCKKLIITGYDSNTIIHVYTINISYSTNRSATIVEVGLFFMPFTNLKYDYFSTYTSDPDFIEIMML